MRRWHAVAIEALAVWVVGMAGGFLLETPVRDLGIAMMAVALVWLAVMLWMEVLNFCKLATMRKGGEE